MSCGKRYKGCGGGVGKCVGRGKERCVGECMG